LPGQTYKAQGFLTPRWFVCKFEKPQTTKQAVFKTTKPLRIQRGFQMGSGGVVLHEQEEESPLMKRYAVTRKWTNCNKTPRLW